EGVREQSRFVAASGFLFAAPQPQMLAKLQSSRSILERVRVYDARAAFGELAFAPFGVVQQQVFAGEEFQHGVAQEFQAFVVLHRGAREGDILTASRTKFRDGGTVRQGAVQQERVVKGVPET